MTDIRWYHYVCFAAVVGVVIQAVHIHRMPKASAELLPISSTDPLLVVMSTTNARAAARAIVALRHAATHVDRLRFALGHHPGKNDCDVVYALHELDAAAPPPRVTVVEIEKGGQFQLWRAALDDHVQADDRVVLLVGDDVEKPTRGWDETMKQECPPDSALHAVDLEVPGHLYAAGIHRQIFELAATPYEIQTTAAPWPARYVGHGGGTLVSTHAARQALASIKTNVPDWATGVALSSALNAQTVLLWSSTSVVMSGIHPPLPTPAVAFKPAELFKAVAGFQGRSLAPTLI